jgi:hypothetical protein
MPLTRTITTLALLGATAMTPAAAIAATAPAHPHSAAGAMRKGIRDFARVAAHDARASRIHVSGEAVRKVGAEGTCTGTFRLTRAGRHADYRLTKRAGTLRISPNAIEYHVAAKAAKKVAGLPAGTGLFSGFLQ